ncbi:MAG: DUF4363 family protein [Clostridia bacterium]|nr:DUF4363 family protein [Clostridia bacterium]
MKRCALVIVAVLSLVAAVCGYCEWYNGHTARRYALALEPVEKAVEEENWEDAASRTSMLLSQWERESGFIQLWINHADTDAVSHALRGLLTAARNADSLSALLFYGDCLENFDHLHHRDAFTLKNIL